MHSSRIKFEIPDERTFSPFPRLPPELRQKIWREAVSTPGMSFVKLESRGRNWRWVSMNRPFSQVTPDNASTKSDDLDEIALEVKNEVAPRRLWDTRLVPISANKKSDISSYHGLNKQIAALTIACGESLDVVSSLVRKKGAVRTSNGKLLALPGSSDIIFLEYLPSELFESGCSYDIDPNCPSLDNIRRVAVRYCHQWQEKPVPSVCPLCGLVHEAASNSVVYPNHLYHFLARHLPNLEEFYFVDYFLLRKAAQSNPSSGEYYNRNLPQRKYKCGPRTYYEADDKTWDVKPQVLRMQEWLQDRFIRYSKASQLSRHQNPEKVRFGILACEWDIAPPVSLKTQYIPSTPKGRNKRVIYEDHALRRQRLRRKSRIAVPVDSNAVAANLPFVFGNPDNSFDFTFEVDWRRM
ncbi:uncharacterized protein TRIVIDRAFT_184533 [Trichoderma virens Gv29-8]|uniref:2EXR domain-containing protein n=1 Tax=Hypocrea virens (strain Gv29-8 / FGSC 10586) TaxID=413071 RepID=G9NB71_HYPVG|nr:uncharacterized protein TRIVIDRAFT_184533 [Trichoderma virens Gv29-8]EHK16079.1 hypothetical protein TRIVIDRAFT_184533 [Trichoderma virens Gv29-8]